MTDIASIIEELKGPAIPATAAEENKEVLARRWQAALRLGSIGAPAVPALVEVLKHENPLVRVAAHDALRNMGEQAAAAVSALVENFTHERWEVRRTAIGTVGYIGPKALAAVPDLVETLRNSTDPDDRCAAAWAIHQMAEDAASKFPEVVSALAGAVCDEEDMVRLGSINALGAMGKAALPALPQLEKALSHEDQLTRIHAAVAIGKLGSGAKSAADALTRALATISEDAHSRDQIRRIIRDLTGKMPDIPPEPEPKIKEHPWVALQRNDFYLVCEPLPKQRRTPDPDVSTQLYLNAEMCNAFCFWPGHTWYSITIPTPEQMKRWNMAAFWYYFTEDVYGPKNQRELGFRTITEYNRSVVEQILRMGAALGKDRCVWSVGHEHMDSGEFWTNRDPGIAPDTYETKEEGYDFYRKWITTSLHKNHWNWDHGNRRPNKFYHGWDCGDPVTWEFVKEHNIDLSLVTMMSGGVSPVLAHAAFDILPQIGWYWWECQVVGTSLQIGTAYTRGAARQYGKKWLLDASPWSLVLGSPHCNAEGENISGVSDSQQMRTWTYGYLAGADCVFEEASNLTHFHKSGADPDQLSITSTGKAAKEVADFCFRRCAERGESYNPVGLLLEHRHGHEPCPHTNFRGRGPWYTLEMGDGEWEIERFWQAVYPGHSELPDPSSLDANAPRMEREPRCLHESVLGDPFDVLTDECPEEVLLRYPRLMTVGGILVGDGLLSSLKRCVEAGAELLVNAAHLSQAVEDDAALGVALGGWVTSSLKGEKCLTRQARATSAQVLLSDDNGHPTILESPLGLGKIVLTTIKHNLTGEVIGSASQCPPDIVEFLQRWVAPVYPAQIRTSQGHNPHFMLNRLADGWIVTIGNHYRGEWAGTVTLRSGEATSVTELWTQSAVEFRTSRGAVDFEAKVPEFSFRVFRVQTSG